MFNNNHLIPEPTKNVKGYTNHKGYVMVYKPEHPHAWANGYVKLHRLVMEVKLGRYLKPEEHIHHKDHDKSNNEPENLILTSMKEHRSIHNKESKKYKSNWNLDEIRTLYNQGKSNREIEKITGMSKSNVAYHIKKMGISRTHLSGKIHEDNPNNQRRITDKEIIKINNLRKDGLTVKEIIKLTGYSRTTIYKYLNKGLISK